MTAVGEAVQSSRPEDHYQWFLRSPEEVAAGLARPQGEAHGADTATEQTSSATVEPAAMPARTYRNGEHVPGGRGGSSAAGFRNKVPKAVGRSLLSVAAEHDTDVDPDADVVLTRRLPDGSNMTLEAYQRKLRLAGVMFDRGGERIDYDAAWDENSRRTAAAMPAGTEPVVEHKPDGLSADNDDGNAAERPVGRLAALGRLGLWYVPQLQAGVDMAAGVGDYHTDPEAGKGFRRLQLTAGAVAVVAAGLAMHRYGLPVFGGSGAGRAAADAAGFNGHGVLTSIDHSGMPVITDSNAGVAGAHAGIEQYEPVNGHNATVQLVAYNRHTGAGTVDYVVRNQLHAMNIDPDMIVGKDEDARTALGVLRDVTLDHNHWSDVQARSLPVGQDVAVLTPRQIHDLVRTAA